MTYSKQNFKDGDVLNAAKLNNIENGIQSVQKSIPETLKNPKELTIKIGSTSVTYDGSEAKTVEIPDGTEVSY